MNGVTNPSFAYDANGNMTSGAGRTISWTAFNMASQIVEGATTVDFTYDAFDHRIIQSVSGSSSSTTTYLNALGAQSRQVVSGATTTWEDYIYAGGALVAERFSGGTSAVRYITTDQLGSVSAVADETAGVTERLSYDAWGKRRNANGSPDTTCSITSAIGKGFTGQEMMDSLCLINMNARIYDPTIGRFLSADPTVPAPFNGQSYNRYTYVLNNPLSLTDPTGLGERYPTHYQKQDGFGGPCWGCIDIGQNYIPNPAALSDTGASGAGNTGTGMPSSSLSSSSQAQLPGFLVNGTWIASSQDSFVAQLESVTVSDNWMSSFVGMHFAQASMGDTNGGNLGFAGDWLSGAWNAIRTGQTRGTIQVGVGVNFTWRIPGTTFGGAFIGSFGVALDTHLNIAGYATYGGAGVGGAFGEDEDIGWTVQASNALTVDDLAGPFNTGSVSAGDLLGGSVDYFTGPSNNGQVVGVGFTAGEGAGFAVTNGLTNTVMCSTSQGCH